MRVKLVSMVVAGIWIGGCGADPEDAVETPVASPDASVVEAGTEVDAAEETAPALTPAVLGSPRVPDITGVLEERPERMDVERETPEASADETLQSDASEPAEADPEPVEADSASAEPAEAPVEATPAGGTDGEPSPASDDGEEEELSEQDALEALGYIQ